MLVVSDLLGFPFRNFAIYAPDYLGFLRAPQIHYAAEQPRPLATGQNTATNRRFSTVISIE